MPMYRFLLQGRQETPRMRVNYPSMPELPLMATGVLEHKPLARQSREIAPDQLMLLPLRPGVPYHRVATTHPRLRFADALFLEALLDVLYPTHTGLSDRAEAAYLGDFAGQLFFLGTVFNTHVGGAYSFLNWNTSLPHTRYLCPTHTPVRADIPVYACVYT